MQIMPLAMDTQLEVEVVQEEQVKQELIQRIPQVNLEMVVLEKQLT